MIDHQRIVQNAFGQKGEGKMRKRLVYRGLQKTGGMYYMKNVKR